MNKFIFIIFLLSSISFAKEIKVMVIDTGLDSNHPLIQNYLNMNDIINHYDSYQDYNGHGTHISALVIKDVCNQVKLYSCSYYYYTNPNGDKLYNCFKRAHNEHMQYINFSSYGKAPEEKEYDALKLILSDPMVIMTTAAGNDGKNLGNPCWGGFPGCYGFKNLIMVGNLDQYGVRYKNSNFGALNMVWEEGVNILSAAPNNKMETMTGTSQATAIYMNKLLKQKCLEINK